MLRRIVLGLDASAGSLAALELATRLAARATAELTALFVEDVNLLRAAALPGAPHLTLPAGAARPLDAPTLESHLRALAFQARRALEQATTSRRLRTRFRVVRGSVASEVLAASLDCDLLILGRPSRGRLPRERPGGTAHTAAERGRVSVLLLPGAAPVERPVRALYDSGKRAPRVLALAAALSEAVGHGLQVLAAAEDEAAAARLIEAASAWLAARGCASGLARFVGAAGPRLATRLREPPESLIVLDAESPLLQRMGLRPFLEAIPGSVLLVR